MTRIEPRKLRMHTLQRLATWSVRHGEQTLSGPVVELELGYRAADALLGVYR